MSSKLTIGEKTLFITSVLLDADGEYFGLCSSNEGSPEGIDHIECFVCNPLNIPPKDAQANNYRVALFTHHHWPESKIVSLRNSKDRYVGLAFSLEALSKEGTALRDDEVNNAYGFFALQQLCLGKAVRYNVERSAISNQTLSITDFYPEDAVVCVFLDSGWRTCVPYSKDFQSFIEATLPFFAKLGLQALFDDAPRSNKTTQNTMQSLDDLGNNRLIVRGMSEDFPLTSRAFLIKLLVEIEPIERHPAFRFFLFYQLFELLMQDLYEDYLKQFRLASKETQYDDPISMRELIDAFKDSLSEKSRIKRILDCNREVLSKAQKLQTHCHNFFADLGQDVEDDTSILLYKIRNHLFHSFSSIESKNVDLSGLDTCFVDFVCELSLVSRVIN